MAFLGNDEPSLAEKRRQMWASLRRSNNVGIAPENEQQAHAGVPQTLAAGTEAGDQQAKGLFLIHFNGIVHYTYTMDNNTTCSLSDCLCVCFGLLRLRLNSIHIRSRWDPRRATTSPLSTWAPTAQTIRKQNAKPKSKPESAPECKSKHQHPPRSLHCSGLRPWCLWPSTWSTSCGGKWGKHFPTVISGFICVRSIDVNLTCMGNSTVVCGAAEP